MPKIVSLSDSTKVHLRDRFTHKMHKELFAALNKGVVWKQSLESGDYEKEMPALNIEMQYESVLPMLTEKIVTRDGKEVPYSQEWLDDLLQGDYRLLEEAATEIRLGPALTDGEGKPVTGENGEKKV